MNKPILPHQIRTAFEGRTFTVQVESITLPSGHALDLEVVRHPGSVVLVPVTDDGRVMLVRQYRAAVGRWLWELPAGTLKPGERPEAAAARECQEEIGLVPGRLEKLGSLLPSPGFCDEEMHFYRATELRTPGPSDAQARPDDDEDLEPGAFDLPEIERLVDSGDIADMKTVAGIALL